MLDIRYFGTHKTGTRLGQSATFTFPDCRSRPGPSPAPPPRCQFYLWIAAWPALLSKSKLIVSDLGRGTELDDRVKTANVASDLSYDDQAPADGSIAATASSMNVTPHVAQNTSGRSSAIDGRTTRHGGYAVSQRIRKRIEEAFGWIKTIAGQEKSRFRGRDRVGWAFTFAAAAYNLVRLPKLIAEAG